ncbi:quinone oxidoreductase [Lysinibacter sp. HNR]|uniref:quinone oxidoreductase family protein n=1 Tax=Lysinibacter sp. HNR TaxID=3031408 RepID=UPI002435E673|nr:quinone oxidoreductase [Lysinibacter sp. HNR]WGD37160.1 quinone oxidoreductase [Lysinibacter sp. HNR]
MIHAVSAATAGGPEVLAPTDIPLPTLGPGQVLVRTHTTGVNFIETYQRSGIYPVSFPFIPGTEASGTVEAVGEGVVSLTVGNRVATCQASETYADVFVVDEDRVFPVPPTIDLETAAAIPLQGLTAHYLCTSVHPASPGETALVHAGAGGVGLLLTQLLVSRGVTVITTTSTPQKAELSRQAGATHTIGYDNFAATVRELTDGEGVNVVYDGVGKTTFDGSLASLRIRGTLALFGGASGQVPPFDLQRLNAAGSLSITRPTLGHFLLTPEERSWRYNEVFNAVTRGELRIRIGTRFPLSEAADAHRALESGTTHGKTILTR